MAILKKLSLRKKTPIKKPVPRGKLIVIDGIDGSGKATQTDLLAQTLELEGYKVLTLSFPQYESKSSGPLQQYLAGEYGYVKPEATSILYAVDRFDASSKIKLALESGVMVIADRYVTANAGHQGAKISDQGERVKFYRWLDNLEYGIFESPKPDLNIILHMPAATAQQLIQTRDKNPETMKPKGAKVLLENLQITEQIYLEIASLFPNMKIIECVENKRLLTPKEISNKVWEMVRRIALKNSFPPNQ